MLKYELKSKQWQQILGFLRSERRVYVGKEANCRRFIEAVIKILRTGMQWSELSSEWGNINSIYKRFQRWEKNGVWCRLFYFVRQTPDMEHIGIDSTIVRAHSDAAGKVETLKIDDEVVTINDQSLGRSRGGFSTKIHLSVDSLGNPLKIRLSGGQVADITKAPELLPGEPGSFILGDKGYDSQAFRQIITSNGCVAVIPCRSNRKEKIEIDRHIYKERHLVENCFNKLKRYRRISTRFEKLAVHYLAFLHLACTLIWLR